MAIRSAAGRLIHSQMVHDTMASWARLPRFLLPTLKATRLEQPRRIAILWVALERKTLCIYKINFFIVAGPRGHLIIERSHSHRYRIRAASRASGSPRKESERLKRHQEDNQDSPLGETLALALEPGRGETNDSSTESYCELIRKMTRIPYKPDRIERGRYLAQGFRNRTWRWKQPRSYWKASVEGRAKSGSWRKHNFRWRRRLQ